MRFDNSFTERKLIKKKCVYLENLLHEDSYNFDIPELEMRPDSVPVPEISEQMDISDAPPLCELRS